MAGEVVDVGVGGTEALLRLCSWCKRMEHEAEWVDLRVEAVQSRIFARSTPPPVTHGICEECAQRMVDGMTRA